MFASWGAPKLSTKEKTDLNKFIAGYYRYLNAHGKTTASTVFLIVGEEVNNTRLKIFIADSEVKWLFLMPVVIPCRFLCSSSYH